MSAGFLLDTNVVLATAPGRDGRVGPEAASVRRWLELHRRQVFLPTIVIAEIAFGIGRLDAAGASRRAAGLAAWLDALQAEVADRVLPLDGSAAMLMRRVSASARSAGIEPGFADLAVAAIALRHDLMIATRNTRHFAALGVATGDPFVM